MAHWEWLTKPERAYDGRFVRNLALKGMLLFVALNVIYLLLDPLPWLSRVTVYNRMVPGRERLPYADNPAEAYNLSLSRIEGMFSAHVIDAAAAPEDTFRVMVLGDSGIWGWLLDDDETLNACLNAGDYVTADGRTLNAFNLGYPITNALKDLLILDYALRYEPDAIIWFMTLEGMYDDDQLDHPIMVSNRERIVDLIDTYELTLNDGDIPPAPDLWDRTIIGQRRELADLLRFQVYGLAWATTQVDHVNPRFFRAPVRNFPDSEGIPNRDYITTGDLRPEYLALDVVAAGMEMAEDAGVPILLINEPIFIADGLNSDLRYNDLYPRWTYDSYRQQLGDLAAEQGWTYRDLWDFVPADAFTDFPLHYTPQETCRVAAEIAPDVLGLASGGR